MNTLFDSETHREIIRRVESIRPDTQRQWGKMSPAQMLEHTSRALEMAIGRKRTEQAMIGKLIGWIFFKNFVGEKPFGKNGPTGPEFIVHDEPDFQKTREKVTALLNEFHSNSEKGCAGNIHGFFGKMSGKEWGVTQYKHMDHHLRQFGV
jgi:uncharacterized protein DUF1569